MQIPTLELSKLLGSVGGWTPKKTKIYSKIPQIWKLIQFQHLNFRQGWVETSNMEHLGGKGACWTPDDLFPQPKNAVTSKSPVGDTSVLTLHMVQKSGKRVEVGSLSHCLLDVSFTSNRQKSLGVLVAIKSSVRSTVDRMTFLWSTGTGRALMFYSLHPNGRPNLSSMHGACKARDGKWRRKWGGSSQLHQNRRYLVFKPK